MKTLKAKLTIREPLHKGWEYTASLRWSDGDISAISAPTVKEIIDWAHSYKKTYKVTINV